MNRHATLVHHRAWRLILTVATGNEDARRTLASDFGEDADTWYQIANIAALQVAQLLDAEYMAAECEAAFYGDCDWYGCAWICGTRTGRWPAVDRPCGRGPWCSTG